MLNNSGFRTLIPILQPINSLPFLRSSYPKFFSIAAIMSAIVNSLDHIFLGVNNAAAVFNQLSNGLGLPVAWPYRSVTPGFTSGAVSLGNLVLEVVDTSIYNITEVQYGVALLPYVTITESRPEAAARGIQVGPDNESFSSDNQLVFTNAPLPQLSSPILQTFFCQYVDDQAPLRRASQEQLEASWGGELGVVRVATLTIESQNKRAVAQTWNRLLWGRSDHEEPLVRVISGSEDRLRALTVWVYDPELARRRFRELVPDYPAGDALPWNFI